MLRQKLIIPLLCFGFTLCDSLAIAQPPGGRSGVGQQGTPGQQSGRGQGGAGGRGMAGGQQTGQPPWLAIFDTDQNGELSESEIKNATVSLLKLDRNKDGKIVGDELRFGGAAGGLPGIGQQRPANGGNGVPAAGQGAGAGAGRSSPPGAAGRGTGSGGGQRGGDQGDSAFAAELKSLDANGDSLIGMDELPEHMHKAFDLADADKSGTLSEKELLVLASQFRRGSLNPDQSQEMKNAPTQGRPQGEGQGAGGGGTGGGQRGGGGAAGQGGQRGRGAAGGGPRGGNEQARNGSQQRERPRDRVSPRDTQFNEKLPLGATLPDALQLYNAERQLVAANSIFKAEYTVVVSGCLTCPEFRNSYPEVEAVAADYRDKGVQFYFLFQSLTHPENWGYVQPTSIQERFAQLDHAAELLQTKNPWLTDTMNNEMKQHFGMTPNSQFVFDRNGKIVHRDSWGRGSSLRESLEKLVGPSQRVTTVAELKLPQFGRQRISEADMLVERKSVEGVAVPLRVVADGEDINAESLKLRSFHESNRYVKLRPEADQQLMKTGTGQLYLGFRQDPILGASWNNLASPPKYRIIADGITMTPAMDESPKLDVESDSEPREFLVDVKNWEPSKPIKVQIQYFGCNKEKGWCKAITQEFTVWLQQDRTAGMVAGRSHFPGGAQGQRPTGQSR